MNARQLAMEVARREGKKIELPIAQIQEVMARMADIAVERPGEYQLAFARLMTRARRRVRRRA